MALDGNDYTDVGFIYPQSYLSNEVLRGKTMQQIMASLHMTTRYHGRFLGSQIFRTDHAFTAANFEPLTKMRVLLPDHVTTVNAALYIHSSSWESVLLTAKLLLDDGAASPESTTVTKSMAFVDVAAARELATRRTPAPVGGDATIRGRLKGTDEIIMKAVTPVAMSPAGKVHTEMVMVHDIIDTARYNGSELDLYVELKSSCDVDEHQGCLYPLMVMAWWDSNG